MSRPTNEFQSIVIPCKNESESLVVLLPIILNELKIIKDNVEVIIVDDGSTDDTKKLLSNFKIQNTSKNVILKIIRLERNVGKVRAQAIGIKHCRTDSALILMDGDGQHPAKYLSQIIQLKKERAGEGPVVGRRRRYSRRLTSIAGTLALKVVTKVLGINYKSGESEYLHLSSEELGFIKSDPSLGILPINVILNKNFKKINYFPFDVEPRITSRATNPLGLVKNRRDTRHELPSLLRKAVAIIFADPWQVLIRVGTVLPMLISVFVFYGLWIGFLAVAQGHTDGIS